MKRRWWEVSPSGDSRATKIRSFNKHPKYQQLLGALLHSGFLLQDLCSLVFEFCWCLAKGEPRWLHQTDLEDRDWWLLPLPEHLAKRPRLIPLLDRHVFQVFPLLPDCLYQMDAAVERPPHVDQFDRMSFHVHVGDEETKTKWADIHTKLQFFVRELMGHLPIDSPLSRDQNEIRLMPSYHQSVTRRITDNVIASALPASTLSAIAATNPIHLRFSWATASRAPIFLSTFEPNNRAFSTDGAELDPGRLSRGNRVSLLFDFPFLVLRNVAQTHECVTAIAKPRLRAVWLYAQ